jgi:hypothetical protein
MITTHNTKKPIKDTKKRTKTEDRPKETKNPYLGTDAWRIVPVTQAAIARLVEDLYKWIEETDALCFDRFLIEKRIGKTCYYEWVKKYPELQAAHTHAIMSLSVNREEGALRNKLNAAMVIHSMPMYSDEWKKNIEWRESIKKPKEDDDKRNITVVIPPFPGSDLVPSKKAKEEL